MARRWRGWAEEKILLVLYLVFAPESLTRHHCSWQHDVEILKVDGCRLFFN